MAEITYEQDFPITGNSNFMRVAWKNVALNDTGLPFVLSQYADRSVQVTGTFGASGSVVIEGSNTGVEYSPLTDPQGNNISLTSSKIEAVSEIVVALRPRVSAGDGTTLLNITMLVRKN